MSECIFCQIIEGKIPSSKVYEDEEVLAFLDITQVTPGHTLVIPKKHVRDLFEYDELLASVVFSKIPKIARALQKAFPEMKGLNLVNNNGEVAYQTVFHSHIHLIPRYSNEDSFGMQFESHMGELSPEEFQNRAQLIHKNIEEA